MVKSPSCFKIITCGSDSSEKDDLEVTEGKGSADKRKWSFRKRSTRHRVLSNTVTTETPTFVNKEVPESATRNFEAQADTTVQEKISVVHCIDEKPQLETVVKEEVPETVVKEEVPEVAVKAEVPEVAVKVEVHDSVVNEEVPEALLETEVLDAVVTIENENVNDVKIDESAVIVIQSAVRGFLARRELLKLKRLVKLQAAVRGHIVRRHAGGTLRCVQAIVKMQALVRARHARVSLEGSCEKKEEDLVKKPSGLNTGIEKLLSNRFARQILESTPKTKPIHVKCDPSKPDSAWKWLERWMSVSSVNAAESNKVVSVTEEPEREKKEKLDSQLETKVEPEFISEPVESKCISVPESIVPSESEDNLITYEADKFDFQACHYTSASTKDSSEQPPVENTSTSDVRETSEDINSLHTHDSQSHVDSEIEHDSLSVEPETEAEQPKPSMKRLASEELESEGSKSIYGLKKATNPSFIAAQSKFEEMSSAAEPGQTLSSSYQEAADESHQDTSFEAQSIIRTKEISVVDSPVHGSRTQIGGSDCGTELSVTSTLDSPDRSDIGATEHVPGPKPSEEEIHDRNNNTKSLDLEVNDLPKITESNPSPSNPDQLEKLNAANCEPVTPIVSSGSPQTELTPEMSDFKREEKSGSGHYARATSPEASPRSYMTGAESQGTPASQASVKERKKKSDPKRASLSAMKKSPSNTHNSNSGSRSSAEKLPKEHKNAKRRTSFGSPKPENGEQEPRDSSSSNNSIPHFMQATESARAKLSANSSPRSSPDVQDGDNYIKKRHSLPGANGRQGSPRIQRSTAQPNPAAKGTERKWQR